MASPNASNITKAVLTTLPSDRRPSEDEVLQLSTAFRQIFSVDDEEFAAILRDLHAKFAITMDMGTALCDDRHLPWLSGRKASLKPYYWDRLMTFLGRQSWPPLVVNALDRVTDEILDLSGDPKREGPRRGLVVGDVQSGKTATYTALCCKAADAGFRLIILLTGTLESLRRQTQERLDEGFVGLDSSEILQTGIRTNRLVGVGHVDSQRTAGVFTSRSRDFSKNLLNQLGFRLDAFQEPVLVVVKKNKRILENLENWLLSYNARSDGTIETPMLLIDDEADSASINTNAASVDATAINARIRTLLKLFRRSTYVGFTATPFANVFIDPDTDDAMLEDDLFPKDFIYSLEAPANYIGPRAVFTDEATRFIQKIDDAEAYFPSSQRSTSTVSALPPSLSEALRSFVIVNALRDLRGDVGTHRSMLVNLSRFTNVQNQVASMLDAQLRELQRHIRTFGRLETATALQQSPHIALLYDLWQRDFQDGQFSWHEVQFALNEAAQPIVVRSVNQTSGALDYKPHKELGLRIIAVGGNSLSRGLTLEGLSTSYFYRNSQMYDTLLQMGRWFGYRDGYADLCRLWITDEAADWYSYIMEATEELRDEFKRMQALSLTPRDFGLKVRAHPESLIVTARNKMRSAETIIRNVSLSEQGPEAARLRSNQAVLDSNHRAAEQFIGAVSSLGKRDLSYKGYFWRSVPKDLVATLLANFQSHPLNFDFQVPMIAAFLRRTTEDKLTNWDVAIASGELESETFAGLSINPIRRILKESTDRQTLLVSGTKLRVGSGGIERLGLTPEQITIARQRAEKQTKPRAVTDADYRAARSVPLLLLYVIRGFTRDGKDDPGVPYRKDRPPLISLGLSFPRFDDSSIASRVEYRVNTIEMRALLPDEAEDDTWDEHDAD